MHVGLRLHIDRGRTEYRGVEPGPRFAGRNLATPEMVGRSRPAGAGESPPLGAFSLGEIHQPLAGECDRRDAVGLRSESGSVLFCPGGEDLEVVVFAEFAESETPVV